jgi:hypothetical protein
MVVKIMRDEIEAMPVIRNNPQKLLRLRLLDETKVLDS